MSPTEECVYCEDPGQFTQNPTIKNQTVAGLCFAVSGAAVVALYAVTVPFLLPALRKVCLPFVPATSAQVQHVMTALKRRSGNVVDLGSGDGRIVLESAKRGFPSVGIELNPWLVWYSRIKARSLGLHKLTEFRRQDLWKVNYSSFNNIVIFGVDQMMPKLEEKLTSDLLVDGCVIACRFPLPTWKPNSIIGYGVDTVWVYHHPTSNASLKT